ncbi:Crp/Fnr family transcriptional regulator [Salinarimonas ramus]|uniref:HTH crp-type domain-containing protein n=1 Tax=Salinarimonas ramus TaxID=690164 RepID=A0A917V7J0_9HYPH|nr:Crp/Fnr family transcriptional regulator [Salinarimonas ramus]GGK46395.1 hypothetical protein GCM10011322_36820 [Salinarimonas ramus]
MSRRMYRNRCLAFLPDADLERLEQRLTPVSYEIGDVLLQADSPIDRIVFLERGLVSYVTRMDDGTSVESLTIGPDSAIGLMGGVGAPRALREAVMHVEGNGFAIATKDYLEAAEASPAIRDMTVRANTVTTAKLLQSVACNAKHSLEQRFARRILACSDASDAKRFALTQEQIADTLGVRRTSVTAAARALRDEGLIAYRHGRIWVENLAGLELRACGCRAAIRAEVDTLLPPHGAGAPKAKAG